MLGKAPAKAPTPLWSWKPTFWKAESWKLNFCKTGAGAFLNPEWKLNSELNFWKGRCCGAWAKIVIFPTPMLWFVFIICLRFCLFSSFPSYKFIVSYFFAVYCPKFGSESGLSRWKWSFGQFSDKCKFAQYIKDADSPSVLSRPIFLLL